MRELHHPGASARASALAFMLLALGAGEAALRADSGDRLRPKLGPHAVTIQQSHEYLRTHEAPDYWALSPFYVPQSTGSACSVAALAMLVNALRGLPPLASDELVTQAALLHAVGSQTWASQTEEGGPGVTFEEVRAYIALSLHAYGIDAEIDVFKPADGSPSTLASLRALLAGNEQSPQDIVMAYFNQGVITGDWDGPHLSPVGAYDGDASRVLIMDVDRQFYLPYWTSDQKLLESMLRPAPAKEGRLAGETGGIFRVMLRSGQARGAPAAGRPQ
jgi:hypothetical protein